jgi:hypothetical protein
MSRHRKPHVPTKQRVERPRGSGTWVTPTSQQSDTMIRFRKRAAPFVITFGLAFLATDGVRFGIDGDTAGATGS